jgi:hypothetical protein
MLEPYHGRNVNSARDASTNRRHAPRHESHEEAPSSRRLRPLFYGVGRVGGGEVMPLRGWLSSGRAPRPTASHPVAEAEEAVAVLWVVRWPRPGARTMAVLRFVRGASDRGVRVERGGSLGAGVLTIHIVCFLCSFSHNFMTFPISHGVAARDAPRSTLTPQCHQITRPERLSPSAIALFHASSP